ncbi:MAG: tRNA pseudouridine(38-40) synthase TruA [Rhodoferax sp.]|nr:tRNA pseudouridine(38-40) synthase TruA [Rhodoferax sp.]MBP6494327.1 tRNA pseudouridine(38-40) synthase TruA [Rhodoferax sp.]
MRLALGISYNGQAYQGWQSQLSGLTVQDKLEAALGRFTDSRVSTLCSGRTDAGVHALMQVIHFDTEATREPVSWVRGTNANLPRDIAVQWAQVVPDAFHCRASAISRRYAYILLESPVRPSIDAGRTGWSFRPLDMGTMQQAVHHLLGEHDFSSFRASACQALSPVKNLQRIDITRRGAYWRFEFEANAFLHHMIRNIMGCLVTVGQGKYPPEWMNQVLAARNRDVAAPTFSPDGLYFLGPRYEAHWGLPDRTPAYDGLP